MSGLPIRVVKVGGSLFGFAGFVAALNEWLAEQPPAVNVLIAGGGKLADVIREADAAWGLGDEAAHWLCVHVMGVSARLLAALLAESRWEAAWDDLLELLPASDGRQPIVFCPVRFLREIEASLPPRPLPHSWSVTSDSIAARIAQVLSAEELVLLKSTDPPDQAADRPPCVDDHFAVAAQGLNHVQFVNLRRFPRA
jgi:aspartokinase-like uncharacterized kinase